MTAPVSYINLMKAQQKRHGAPSLVSVPPMSRNDMLAAGRAARARLMGQLEKDRPEPKPQPAVAPESPLEAAEVVDDAPKHFAPLDMLTPCGGRFLLSVVALQTAISEQTLTSVSKVRHVVEARDKLIRLIFEHTQHSLPMIGRLLHRDHTTILHSLRKSGCYYRLVEMAPSTDVRSRGAFPISGGRDVIVIEPSASSRSTSLPMAEDIIDETCQKYGLTPEDLRSRRRGRSLASARQEAIYRIFKETKLSQPEIGRVMGFRDHSIVSYSVKAHEARLAGTKYLRGRAA